MSKNILIKTTVVGLAGSALLLAGCTSSGHPSKASTTAASSTSSTTAPATPAAPAGGASSSTPAASTKPAENDPTVAKIGQNNVTRRDQTTVTVCSGDRLGWTATGTAKNPDSSAHTYSIIVYFSNSKGTVIGSGTTKKAVAAKSSGTWSVSAKFAAPTKVNCVLVSVQ